MNLKNPLVSILTEREGDYRFFEAFRTREPVREVLTLSRRCFPGRVWEGAFFKKRPFARAIAGTLRFL